SGHRAPGISPRLWPAVPPIDRPGRGGRRIAGAKLGSNFGLSGRRADRGADRAAGAGHLAHAGEQVDRHHREFLPGRGRRAWRQHSPTAADQGRTRMSAALPIPVTPAPTEAMENLFQRMLNELDGRDSVEWDAGESTLDP